MRTLGVDLAADPARTAACVIDWSTGTVSLLPRPTSDDAIVEAVLAADLTGIDVPLGWPDAFVDALVAHREDGPWPTMATPVDRHPMRFRITDIDAQGAGFRPLSVSTDLLGIPALRGAHIQHLLRAAGATVDRSGTTGCLFESYPAAALRTWGLTSTGYKGRANLGVLRDLVAAFAPRCGPIADAVAHCLASCDDDELDAVVCAVLARGAIQGQVTSPAPDQLAAARREGWIRLPTATLEAVVTDRP